MKFTHFPLTTIGTQRPPILLLRATPSETNRTREDYQSMQRRVATISGSEVLRVSMSVSFLATRTHEEKNSEQLVWI